MSNRANDAVISLRNFDGIDLEEESDEEDGKGPAVKEILKARHKAMHRWNTFFILLCAFAVFIDPLFCYLFVAERDKMCVSFDVKLAVIYLVLRLAIDVCYFIDIIIFLCGIWKKRKGRIFESCCWKPRTDQKLTVIPLKQVIKRRCFRLLPILPRILVALPIPEGLLFFAVQFVLFGALWYHLSVQRQLDCWMPHCQSVRGDSCKDFVDFICGPKREVNITRLQELCPIDSEDKKVFDFGIYLYALQSNSTCSFNLPRRISQSFWWALRNLSSFGSNLSTSMHTLEIFFSIAISISGMVLFLVYLNARVKESQERSAQLKLKENKHLMRPDLDLWLSKNISNLKTMTKDSKVLKTRNKKKKALKMVIIENIHKLEETQAIDVQNIIFILPIKYKKSIKRLLCLASLRKVPMLANLNEKMLKVICEHLKPIIYIEDNYIVQEGKPLGMMLLITQGIAYTTGNNDGVGTSYGSSSNKWLKRGDYYGEELLNWAFKCPFYSDLPISTRTVMSQQKVEAFALRASDLKSIVSIYWWHFTRNLPQVQLEQWKNLAASSTLAAWRRARAKRSGWGKFTVEY